MNRYRSSMLLLLFVAMLINACQPVMSVGTDNPAPGEAENGSKVLLILRENHYPSDEQALVTDEAFMMKGLLEEAGFIVVTASASGKTFFYEERVLESDMTLPEVNTSDYLGFVMPCLCPGTHVSKPEEVTIAKQITAEGKPVAAQRHSVYILAEAGALDGKRYSYESEPIYEPVFETGIYDGNGVVQDGNIITSSYCPHKMNDQTVLLLQALIAELQG